MSLSCIVKRGKPLKLKFVQRKIKQVQTFIVLFAIIKISTKRFINKMKVLRIFTQGSTFLQATLFIAPNPLKDPRSLRTVYTSSSFQKIL